jgi:hypothetical protein
MNPPYLKKKTAAKAFPASEFHKQIPKIEDATTCMPSEDTFIASWNRAEQKLLVLHSLAYYLLGCWYYQSTNYLY